MLVPKELVAWWVKHHSLRLHVLFNRKNNNNNQPSVKYYPFARYDCSRTGQTGKSGFLMEQAMEKESWFDDQHRNFRRQQGRISWKTSKNEFWIPEGSAWWQDHHLHRWIKIRDQLNRRRLGLHHQFQLLSMESMEPRIKMRSFWCRTFCYQKGNRFCLWESGFMDTRNLDFFE